MNERQWERMGASAGIVFVVLLVLSAFIVPQPPHIDATTDKIARFVANHHKALLTSNVLGLFSVAAFLWFVGHLRHVLERAEGGVEALSPIVTASGTALAAIGAASILPTTALALMANSPEGLKDANIVRLLFDLNNIAANGLVSMVGAVFLASAGLAMVRKELVAPWLGWVSLAVAAVLAVGSVGALTVTTYNAGWTALNLIGLLGFSAVILVASALMVWQPETERAVAHPPVFVH